MALSEYSRLREFAGRTEHASEYSTTTLPCSGPTREWHADFRQVIAGKRDRQQGPTGVEKSGSTIYCQRRRSLDTRLKSGEVSATVMFLRRQFLQEEDLPFREVLSEELVQEALATVCVAWNDAIYTPLVTLWIFLSQVLSADHSCRSGVALLIAHRISGGQRTRSP